MLPEILPWNVPMKNPAVVMLPVALISPAVKIFPPLTLPVAVTLPAVSIFPVILA